MNFLMRTTLLCLALTFIACGGQDPSPSEPAPSSEEKAPKPAEFAPKPPPPGTYTAGSVLFPWVDQLNIREKPNTSAKRIGKALRAQPVTFSGEKTESKETIVLRGVAYDDYWLKVTTKDQTEGWVFAGALKGEAELKGNIAMSDTRFSYPVFGDYDLSKWDKTGETDDGGGDAESTTSTYKKDDQILRVNRTEVGEYGYSNTFTLTNTKGDLLKSRTFNFEVDPELLIRETVIDYLSMKEYVRTQPMGKHFMQLNDRPQMVRGEWTITEL